MAKPWEEMNPAEQEAHLTGELIEEYTDTWRLLVEYDENRLATLKADAQGGEGLEYGNVVKAIAQLTDTLRSKGEASDLFGNTKDEALKSILGSIEQTMFGESLYRSRKEKAAHLLYFVVKGHPFTDGNKRIGALLFLLYLKREGIAHGINAQALTALTLLTAQSDANEKDTIVGLIANLIGARKTDII